MIPPLSPTRFDGSFGHFCDVKGFERTTPHVGQREVSLHSLHEQVMKHRGYIDEVPHFPPPSTLIPFPPTSGHDAQSFFLSFFSFQRKEEFWLKIARKLGFISPDIPSTPNEIAYQLAEVYRDHLEQFDKIYVMSYMQEVEHRRAINAAMIG